MNEMHTRIFTVKKLASSGKVSGWTSVTVHEKKLNEEDGKEYTVRVMADYPFKLRLNLDFKAYGYFKPLSRSTKFGDSYTFLAEKIEEIKPEKTAFKGYLKSDIFNDTDVDRLFDLFGGFKNLASACLLETDDFLKSEYLLDEAQINFIRERCENYDLVDDFIRENKGMTFYDTLLSNKNKRGSRYYCTRIIEHFATELFFKDVVGVYQNASCFDKDVKFTVKDYLQYINAKSPKDIKYDYSFFNDKKKNKLFNHISDLLNKNPYTVLQWAYGLEDFSTMSLERFKVIDKIATSYYRVPLTSLYRIKFYCFAVALSAMKENNDDLYWYVCSDTGSLVDHIRSDLGLAENDLTAKMFVDIITQDKELLHVEDMQDGTFKIYPKYIYNKLVSATETLADILETNDDISMTSHELKIIDDFIDNQNASMKQSSNQVIQSLDDYQKSALHMSVRHKFSIINGGPGRGKTTILTGLCNIGLHKQNKNVLVCCFTGKAVTRCRSVLNEFESYRNRNFFIDTIDKFKYDLEYLNKIGDYKKDSVKNRDVLIIVDEAGMVDLAHLCDIFDVAKVFNDAHFVFIGDIYQLEPINKGRSLRKLIDLAKSDIIPFTELEINHRAVNSDLESVYKAIRSSNIYAPELVRTRDYLTYLIDDSFGEYVFERDIYDRFAALYDKEFKKIMNSFTMNSNMTFDDVFMRLGACSFKRMSVSKLNQVLQDYHFDNYGASRSSDAISLPLNMNNVHCSYFRFATGSYKNDFMGGLEDILSSSNQPVLEFDEYTTEFGAVRGELESINTDTGKFFMKNGTRIIWTKNIKNIAVWYRDINNNIVASESRDIIVNGDTGFYRGVMGDYVLLEFDPMDISERRSGVRAGCTRLVVVSVSDAKAYMSPGYVLTVHKMQGSEYDSLLYFMGWSDGWLNKNLLYTALTRAKFRACTVGSKRAYYEVLGGCFAHERSVCDDFDERVISLLE